MTQDKRAPFSAGFDKSLTLTVDGEPDGSSSHL